MAVKQYTEIEKEIIGSIIAFNPQQQAIIRDRMRGLSITEVAEKHKRTRQWVYMIERQVNSTFRPALKDAIKYGIIDYNKIKKVN